MWNLDQDTVFLSNFWPVFARLQSNIPYSQIACFKLKRTNFCDYVCNKILLHLLFSLIKDVDLMCLHTEIICNHLLILGYLYFVVYGKKFQCNKNLTGTRERRKLNSTCTNHYIDIRPIELV